MRLCVAVTVCALLAVVQAADNKLQLVQIVRYSTFFSLHFLLTVVAPWRSHADAAVSYR